MTLFVLNLLLQVTLVAGVALMAGLFLKRQITIRHGVLLAALFLIALSPLSTLAFLRLGWGVISLPAKAQTAATVEHRVDPDEQRLLPAYAAGVEAVEGAGAVSVPRKESILSTVVSYLKSWFSPMRLLVLIWLGGTLLGLVRLVLGIRKMHRILKEATPFATPELDDLLREAGHAVGLRTSPRIFTTTAFESPVAFGIFSHRILIPEPLAGRISPTDLRQVLTHELAHLARRDPAVALFQKGVACLFWMHPLIHLLNLRLTRAREEICDNFVLALPGVSGPGYCRLLLELAEWIGAETPLPAGTALGASAWKLETRAAGILDQHRDKRTRLPKSGIAVLVGFVMLLLAVSAFTIVLPELNSPNRGQSKSTLPALPHGRNGLASEYPGDRGIAGDSRVLFAEGFDSTLSAGQLDTRWDVVYGEGISLFPGGPTGIRGEKSLLFTIAPTIGKSGDPPGRGIAKNLAVAQDVLFLRWYEKLDANWNTPKQWNSHGLTLSASYFEAGESTYDIPADGTNKFLIGVGNINMFGVAPGNLGLFLNWPGQVKSWGDYAFPSGKVLPFPDTRSGTATFGEVFTARPETVLELGRWYCLETMLQANQPGRRDGRAAIWVDGALVADFPNLRLRDVPELKIDRIDFMVSLKQSSQTNRKWIDNIVAAKSYIGPVEGLGLAP